MDFLPYIDYLLIKAILVLGERPMALDKSLECFEKNRSHFARTQHGKFVVIHDDEVLGFYDDITSAYKKGADNYEPGTFLIRKCLREEEEEPVVTYSRVA